MPRGSLLAVRWKGKWLFGPSRACGPGRSAGTVPSAPVVGCCRLQASRERVVARQRAVRDRDLSPARDTELLAEYIGVRLRRSRGNAKPLADLVVRAAGCDQLDHLDLSLGEARNRSSQSVVHGREANPPPRAAPLTERCISRLSGRSQTIATPYISRRVQRLTSGGDSAMLLASKTTGSWPLTGRGRGRR